MAVTVSGILQGTDGAPLANTLAEFVRVDRRVVGLAGTAVVPAPESVSTDASGALSINLEPGQYTLRVVLPTGALTGSVTIPSGGASIALADALVQAPESIVIARDEALAARDEAVAAASDAASSASAASSSASDAANSATAAATSETNAAASATAAATSETNDASSASAAATSETNAANSASAAAASETNAANSASAAAASASDAASSASAAQQTYDTFIGTYYGAFASDPAADPLGNPPQDGDLYTNTTSGALMVYVAGAWQGYSPTVLTAHTHPWADINVAKGDILLTAGINQLGALGSSGTITIDLTAGDFFSASLAGNTTFAFSGADQVDTFALELANGGSYTVTWPSSVRWSTGSPPALTATGKDTLVFYTIDGGATWNGVRALEAVA